MVHGRTQIKPPSVLISNILFIVIPRNGHALLLLPVITVASEKIDITLFTNRLQMYKDLIQYTNGARLGGRRGDDYYNSRDPYYMERPRVCIFSFPDL